MSGIKGLVILTRFDYIETNYGRQRLKEFMDKIELADKTIFQQPIGISKEYPELILRAVDSALKTSFLENKVDAFLELGHWNARHLMPRYFQVFIDEKNPAGFLKHMTRMRDILIGLGEMSIVEMEPNSHLIRINYGQPFLESVRLSEIGFLEEGLRLCGAQNVETKLTDENDMSVEYKLTLVT